MTIGCGHSLTNYANAMMLYDIGQVVEHWVDLMAFHPWHLQHQMGFTRLGGAASTCTAFINCLSKGHGYIEQEWQHMCCHVMIRSLFSV